ncbi:MAG: 1-phosphofructokinase family hexose kinase [Lachnospirales bacterium]
MSNQIYTVTFNPSVDYVVRCKSDIVGGVNELTETDFFVGGKGINVSKALRNFSYNSTAFGFLGGFTGDFIRSQFTRKGISQNFIEIPHNTRMNVKIKKTDIELDSSIAPIDRSHFEELLERILHIEKNSYFVIAGSAPRGCEYFYEEILEAVKDKELKIILDFKGKELLNCLKFKPFLVKPNLRELSDYFETKIENEEDTLKYARELQSLGAKNVLVTCGSKGGYLVTDNDVYEAVQKEIDVENAVGCGDSVLAGFIMADINCKNDEEKLHFAIKVGVTTATLTDLASKEEFDKIADDVISVVKK